MRYLLLLLLAAAAALAHADQMYRWTDKDGKVQYGTTPPPGVEKKAVKNVTNVVAPQTPVRVEAAEAERRRENPKPPPPSSRVIDRTKQY